MLHLVFYSISSFNDPGIWINFLPGLIVSLLSPGEKALRAILSDDLLLIKAIPWTMPGKKSPGHRDRQESINKTISIMAFYYGGLKISMLRSMKFSLANGQERRFDSKMPVTIKFKIL